LLTNIRSVGGTRFHPSQWAEALRSGTSQQKEDSFSWSRSADQETGRLVRLASESGRLGLAGRFIAFFGKVFMGGLVPVSSVFIAIMAELGHQGRSR
jgi:hypothetical protein